MNRYKTFKTATGYCTIDFSREINVGDWYFANEALRKCVKIKDGKYPYVHLNDDGEEVADFHTWKGVIIACHPPLENVATYCELPKDDAESFTLEDMRKCWNYAADLFEEHTLEGGSLEMNFDQFIATLSKQPDWQFVPEIESIKVKTGVTDNCVEELIYEAPEPKIINNVLQGHWVAIPPTPSTIG